MDKIHCPIFFLQGDADNDNRKNDAKDGYKIMQDLGKPTEYFLVESGRHGLENRADICAEKTIEFVKKCLQC